MQTRRSLVKIDCQGTPAPSIYYAAADLLEQRLHSLLPTADEEPQNLHRAMRHSVFGGGKRLRPRLLVAVAAACGADAADKVLVLNAACAIEFIHCASLIHDDLPVFDNAPQRRGRPTVHVQYGEPLAILAGDALLSRAYEVLAEVPSRLAHRALQIIRLMGTATGSREGIIGGQSLEQPPQRDDADTLKQDSSIMSFPPDVVERYHIMKSAALFRLAASAGAVVSGSANREAWGKVGCYLGQAFQLADDLCDVSTHVAAAGKPLGRDATLGRPNAALASGPREVSRKMWTLFRNAYELAVSLAAEPQPLVALLDQVGSHFKGVAE